MMGWVDVETTGLDPQRDFIVEVGCIITDDNLEELARTSWVIHAPPKAFTRIYDNEIVYEMHVANGLLEELVKGFGTPIGLVREELEKFVAPFTPNLPMCGSSVHFDRAMLHAWMPSVEALFHYRNCDVSTLKELAQRWWPNMAAIRPAERKLHRVIPDIEDSIAELRHYRSYIDEAIEGYERLDSLP